MAVQPGTRIRACQSSAPRYQAKAPLPARAEASSEPPALSNRGTGKASTPINSSASAYARGGLAAFEGSFDTAQAPSARPAMNTETTMAREGEVTPNCAIERRSQTVS